MDDRRQAALPRDRDDELELSRLVRQARTRNGPVFAAAYTQDLETHTIRVYCGERDEEGVPIWHEIHTDVENVIAMMPTTRMLELDWQRLADLSVPADHEHDFKTGPTRFYRGEDDNT